MSLDAFLERLNREERFASCIASWKTIPAQESVDTPLPDLIRAWSALWRHVESIASTVTRQTRSRR
jgi:hypothetical protein